VFCDLLSIIFSKFSTFLDSCFSFWWHFLSSFRERTKALWRALVSDSLWSSFSISRNSLSLWWYQLSVLALGAEDSLRLAKSVSGSKILFLNWSLIIFCSCLAEMPKEFWILFSRAFCYTDLAFWANYIELMDSWRDEGCGLRQMIRWVIESPLFRQPFMMCVSFVSLYGMWWPDLADAFDAVDLWVTIDTLGSSPSCLFFRAYTTFPNAERDLLMYFASLIRFWSCSPTSFSLPARSTNVNRDISLSLSRSTALIAILTWPYLLPPIY